IAYTAGEAPLIFGLPYRHDVAQMLRCIPVEVGPEARSEQALHLNPLDEAPVEGSPEPAVRVGPRDRELRCAGRLRREVPAQAHLSLSVRIDILVSRPRAQKRGQTLDLTVRHPVRAHFIGNLCGCIEADALGPSGDRGTRDATRPHRAERCSLAVVERTECREAVDNTLAIGTLRWSALDR